MTDETDPTTDAPAAPIVDPVDEETPVPEEEDFVAALGVTRAGDYRTIRQERTRGDVQTIILDGKQAHQVGWALLSDDEATNDQASEVTGFVKQGGRFT